MEMTEITIRYIFFKSNGNLLKFEIFTLIFFWTGKLCVQESLEVIVSQTYI